MGNYTRTYNPQPTQRVGSAELKGEFQAIENAFNTEASEAERTLRQTGGSAVNALPNAASRANKVLSFDASGHPAVPIAVVDLTNAVTAASNAATSATNAASSASSASTSATNAAASATAAAASAESISGGPVASVNGMTGVVVISSLSGITLNDGYTEEVFAITGTTPALNPANGSIQTWTLTAGSTPTDSLSNGQSIILGITASSYSVTWPSTTWSKVGGGGAAPMLTSSGVNWVILWKVGGTLRGAFLGTA